MLSLTDIILETEREAKPPPQSISNLRGVEYIQNDIAVWRGDITTLKVDAIVNAANEAGEGCYVASHRCIDNVIHRASGPRLRKVRERERERERDKGRGAWTGGRGGGRGGGQGATSTIF